MRANFKRWSGRGGFSLVELVVVIGVLLILASIALPLLGRTKTEAVGVRRMNQTRQAGVLTLQYCTEQRDTFPMLYPQAYRNELRLPERLESAGLIKSEADLDPDFESNPINPGHARIAIGRCFYVDPTSIRRGIVAKWSDQAATALTIDAVTSPSRKGMVFTWVVDWQGEPAIWLDRKKQKTGSVAMVDGSAVLGRMGDFVAGELLTENWAGWPVSGTWEGIKGMDR